MSFEKLERIKRWEITVLRLPSPLGDLEGVGFVVTGAVPSFEDLFAAAVVRSGSGVRVVDPRAVGEVARAGSVGFWGEDGGGAVGVWGGEGSAF